MVYLTTAPKPWSLHPYQGRITEVPSPSLIDVNRCVYSPSARVTSMNSVSLRLTRWARESSLSSRAKVTSVNSQCEDHLPSVKVNLSEQIVEIIEKLFLSLRKSRPLFSGTPQMAIFFALSQIAKYPNIWLFGYLAVRKKYTRVGYP